MRKKGYSFFENLYGDSADSVICIDEGLNVVFATKSIYTLFDTDRESFTHVSYVLPMRNCYILQDAVKKSKSTTFVSRNITDGNEYKITIVPYSVDDEKYSIISFNLIAEKTKSKRDEFIDIALRIIMKELAQCTSSIVNSSEELDDEKRLRVINSVRRIRKLFDSFNTVLGDSGTDNVIGPIDLNRYFTFFIGTVYRFIGNDKADIHFVPSTRSASVCISQQALDIICCNAVAIAIKNTMMQKARISIAVERTADSLLILFSDNDPNSYSADNENSKLSFALIEKLANKFGGNFVVSDDSRIGTTIAVTLPYATVQDVLYSPEEFDTEGIFSTFAIMLSDI